MKDTKDIKETIIAQARHGQSYAAFDGERMVIIGNHDEWNIEDCFDAEAIVRHEVKGYEDYDYYSLCEYLNVHCIVNVDPFYIDDYYLPLAEAQKVVFDAGVVIGETPEWFEFLETWQDGADYDKYVGFFEKLAANLTNGKRINYERGDDYIIIETSDDHTTTYELRNALDETDWAETATTAYDESTEFIGKYIIRDQSKLAKLAESINKFNATDRGDICDLLEDVSRL